MEKGTKLVIEYMDMLLDGTETAIPQGKRGATYFGRDTIDYSNISIDLRKTADQIKHQIRAFCFPGNSDGRRGIHADFNDRL